MARYCLLTKTGIVKLTHKNKTLATKAKAKAGGKGARVEPCSSGDKIGRKARSWKLTERLHRYARSSGAAG